MLIGGLTLGLGILAVLGAIIYRITNTDANRTPVAAGPAVPGSPGNGEAASVTQSLAALGLAAEARLVSTSATADRVVLTYAAGGDTVLLFIDPATGAVVARLRLTP